MGYDGGKGGIPRVVKDCIQYLRESGIIMIIESNTALNICVPGLEEEGLFRRSPLSVMLRQAQEAYDRGKHRRLSSVRHAQYSLGQVLSLATFDDPHLAAVLIKKYLRDLPEPLFPESLYSLIRRCPTPLNDPTDISAVTYVRDTILTELAPCSYILLSHILRESMPCPFRSHN
jgi:Rho GTPase-activating protein 1